jgi:hypothetical protein
VAEAISEKAETPLLVARMDTAPEDLPAWQRLIDLCYREATLQGAAVCWTGASGSWGDLPSGRWQALVSAAAGCHGPTLLGSHTTWDPAWYFQATPFLRLDVPTPDSDIRRRQWEAHVPPGIAHSASADLRDLTDQFKLSGANLRAIVQDATVPALKDATASKTEDPPMITLRHLKQATAQEYRRQGKPANTPSSLIACDTKRGNGCTME